jgi:hypothetical protein
MKRRRTIKKGGDCCLYENETSESCKGSGANPEGSRMKNRDFYSEEWHLSWKGSSHRVQLNIKYHALKHMDSIGMNCYEETSLVEWIKSNLIDANIFGNNMYPYYGIDVNSHKITFPEFVHYFYSKKPPPHQDPFTAYQIVPRPPNPYNPAHRYKIVFNAEKPYKLLYVNVFHISKTDGNNVSIYDCNFNDQFDARTCPKMGPPDISSTELFPVLVSPAAPAKVPPGFEAPAQGSTPSSLAPPIGVPPDFAAPPEGSILSSLAPPVNPYHETVTPPTDTELSIGVPPGFEAPAQGSILSSLSPPIDSYYETVTPSTLRASAPAFVKPSTLSATAIPFFGVPPGFEAPAQGSILSSLSPPIDSYYETITPSTLRASAPAFVKPSTLSATAIDFVPKASIVSPNSRKGGKKKRGKKTRRYRKK